MTTAYLIDNTYVDANYGVCLCGGWQILKETAAGNYTVVSGAVSPCPNPGLHYADTLDYGVNWTDNGRAGGLENNPHNLSADMDSVGDIYVVTWRGGTAAYIRRISDVWDAGGFTALGGGGANNFWNAGDGKFDNSNDMHIFMDRRNAGAGTHSLYHYYQSGGVWQAVEVIGSAETDYRGWALSCCYDSGTNTFHLLCVDANHTSHAGYWNLKYIYGNTGSWTEEWITELDGNFLAGQIILLSDGTPVCSFTGTGYGGYPANISFLFAARTGGSWSAPEVVYNSTNSQIFQISSITRNSNDEVLVIAHRYEGVGNDSISYWIRSTGGTWSSSYDLTTDTCYGSKAYYNPADILTSQFYAIYVRDTGDAFPNGRALYWATITDSAPGLTHTPSDTLALADVMAGTVGMNQTDTLALAESLSVLLGLNLVDTLTLSDAVAKDVGVGVTETLTLADSMEYSRRLYLTKPSLGRVKTLVVVLRSPRGIP